MDETFVYSQGQTNNSYYILNTNECCEKKN